MRECSSLYTGQHEKRYEQIGLDIIVLGVHMALKGESFLIVILILVIGQYFEVFVIKD